VFAGKLDHASLSRVERLMVRALRTPEGDFRDWDGDQGVGAGRRRRAVCAQGCRLNGG
jgi:menaquinone-dependent protoporphyrinogen oxidase